MKNLHIALIVAAGIIVLFFVGVLLAGSPVSLAGTWQCADETGHIFQLEFTDSGTGISRDYYANWAEPASKLGLSGYVKSFIWSFTYYEIETNKYNIYFEEGVLETYSGQKYTLSGAEVEGIMMGTVTAKHIKSAEWLVWEDDWEIYTLNRI
jgi:hypothetical protein